MPRFFKQCYYDPASDLATKVQPKRGIFIILTPKPILPVWRGRWQRFYDPNARLGLTLGFAHSTYREGESGISREDFEIMRIIWSEDAKLPAPEESRAGESRKIIDANFEVFLW